MMKPTTIGKVGGWAAFLCAIHCMVTPLLVIALPLLGYGFWSFVTKEWFEVAMLATATVLSSASLCWGLHQHGKTHALWFMIAGVVWFVVGHWYGHSLWFSLAGGLCFLTASMINHRLCKTCGRCCEH